MNMDQLLFELDTGHTVAYDLADTPVADITRSQMQGREFTVYNSWNEGSTTAVQALVDRLRSTADQLGLATEDLNELHLAFERAHKSGASGPRWEQLNRLIHSLENHGGPRVLGVHLTSDPPYPVVSITDQIRPYWAHEIRRGDCCLGYATIGKDLAQAAINDDHELVRIKGLSPQIEIRTEFLLITADPANPLTNRQMHRAIYQWTRRRAVDDCVDWNQAYNRCHGRPLIARIQDPQQLSLVSAAEKILSVRLVCK